MGTETIRHRNKRYIQKFFEVINMKVKNFKRKMQEYKKGYLKGNLSKIIISLVICFAVLGGVYSMGFKTISTQSAYAKSYKHNAPWLGMLFAPSSDRSTFSVTIAPLPNCPHPTSGLDINIFAIPGHKTIDQIPVVDYQDEDLPAPSFKLVQATNIHKLYKDNVPVTYSFDTSVFTDGQEYTIFAYYQSVSVECEHYFSELYHYTHLVPVPLPPDPVKEGYTFVGWFYDEDFTQPYDGAPLYEDTVLYAKFVPNVYTISFDTLGGNTLEPIQAEYNTTITPPTPTRLGHKFLGWYIDINLTEPFDAENTLITSDITLYAKWEVQTVTVTFMVDGEVYTTLEVPYGSILINDTTAAQYVAAMGKLYTDSEKKSIST